MTIRELIEARGLKKAAVAKSIGLRPSSFSKFLHEWEPLPKRCVEPLAKLLGLSIAEIECNQIAQATFAPALASTSSQ